MTDMLVRLYEIDEPISRNLAAQEPGIEIRPAIAPEKHIVTRWVTDEFAPNWASECEVAFSNHPVSCIVAVCANKLLGFACYNATFKGALGPIGVLPSNRMQGVGRELLLYALTNMRNQGYAYAIIGAAGPEAFFAKAVGAIPIDNSSPGPYKGMLT